MSFLHNILKMKYSYIGYLPNTPYHLISDEEMYDAFITEEDGAECFFFDNYPCLVPDLADVYGELVKRIREEVQKAKSNPPDHIVPDWVYSYMLGEVITVTSDARDIHDLCKDFLLENTDDEFVPYLQVSCHLISKNWIRKKSDETDEPVTIFGAPHVLKSLRLQELHC